MQVLLDANADPNVQKPNDKTTAVFMASMRGHTDVVQELISAGADINLSSSRFGTPLKVAKAEGKTEVIELLTAHATK